MRVKLINVLDKLILFLIAFLPLALISGPLLSDAIVVVVSLMFVFLLFNKNFEYKKYKYYIYFFLLFYFFLLIATFFSSNFNFSIKTGLPYIRIIIFIFAVLYIAIKKKFIFFQYMQICFFFTFAFLCLDSSFQIIFQKSMFGIEQLNPRVSGIFGDELILGSYIVRMLPLYIGVYFINRNYFSRSFNLINKLIIIFSFFIIFFSGERTAFFLALFILLTSTIFLKRKKIIFILTSVLFFFILLLFSNNKIYLIDRYESLISNKLNTVYQKSEYSVIHNQAFVLIKQNIFLGVGPNNFQNECKKISNSCSTHPHNIYLELFVETGIFLFIVSFICYLYIFCFYIKNLFLHYKSKVFTNESISKLFFLTSVIINFFPFIGTGSLFNNWFSIIIFFSLSFFMISHDSKK